MPIKVGNIVEPFAETIGCWGGEEEGVVEKLRRIRTVLEMKSGLVFRKRSRIILETSEFAKRMGVVKIIISIRPVYF
jgi:hypothetical protein